MFKITEELMQKIKEVVTAKEPVLAAGNMKMMANCTCGMGCSYGCGRACSTSCSSNSRLR